MQAREFWFLVVYPILVLAANGCAGVNFARFKTESFPCDFAVEGGATVHENVAVLLECGTTCSLEPECRSFTFEEDVSKCSVHTGFRSLTPVPSCGRAVVYGTKILAPIRGQCVLGDPCAPANSACIDSMCTCLPGYSYDHNNDSCVTSCSSYGNTFQKDRGALLNGMSYSTVHSVDAGGCMSHCLGPCRAFFIYLDASQCYLSVDTALTAPGAYVQSALYDLYQRDCQ